MMWRSPDDASSESALLPFIERRDATQLGGKNLKCIAMGPPVLLTPLSRQDLPGRSQGVPAIHESLPKGPNEHPPAPPSPLCV